MPDTTTKPPVDITPKDLEMLLTPTQELVERYKMKAHAVFQARYLLKKSLGPVRYAQLRSDKNLQAAVLLKHKEGQRPAPEGKTEETTPEAPELVEPQVITPQEVSPTTPPPPTSPSVITGQEDGEAFVQELIINGESHKLSAYPKQIVINTQSTVGVRY